VACLLGSIPSVFHGDSRVPTRRHDHRRARSSRTDHADEYGSTQCGIHRRPSAGLARRPGLPTLDVGDANEELNPRSSGRSSTCRPEAIKGPTAVCLWPRDENSGLWSYQAPIKGGIQMSVMAVEDGILDLDVRIVTDVILADANAPCATDDGCDPTCASSCVSKV
jgi:FxLD family lantipeptide